MTTAPCNFCNDISCAYALLLLRLSIIFGCGAKPHYEIDLAMNSITCYTANGIVWGRISADNSLGNIFWNDYTAKVELYFTNYELSAKTTEDMLKVISLDVYVISPKEYTLTAKHEIYFT